MNKQQIKTLCEADSHLLWLAMVLFAEICGIEKEVSPDEHQTGWSMVRAKVAEFPRLVIQQQLERSVGEASELEQLKKRVEELERRIG